MTMNERSTTQSLILKREPKGGPIKHSIHQKAEFLSVSFYYQLFCILMIIVQNKFEKLRIIRTKIRSYPDRSMNCSYNYWDELTIGLFLRRNHLLRCWGWPSLPNWIVGSYIISIANIASKKIGALSFVLLRLLHIFINPTYTHV